MTISILQPTLASERLLIRPMCEDDYAALYALAADKELWAQHPGWDRYQEPVFRDYFVYKLALGGMLALIDQTANSIFGTSSFGFDPANANQIEIGSTFIARSHWGMSVNRDVKRLMVEHALKHCERVVFRVGADNTRSRRAMEKIGATLTERREEHQFHGIMVPHVIYEFTPGSFRASPLAR